MPSPSSEDPVLILIHGAAGNGRMWDAVRRELSPRWRVIAPDLPGHGARRGEAFSLQGAVDTVVAAARSVAPAPVVVGGDSLGGYTSLASAQALPPSQLQGLMLAGCTANMVGGALRALLIRQVLLVAMGTLLGAKRMANLTAKELRNMGIADEDVNAQVTAGFNHGVFPQAVRALRGTDFRAKLAAVTQPVMVVNGAKDKIFVDQEASFVAVAKRATCHRFADCEHGVSLRRSREFAALVNNFVLGLGTE